MAKKPNDTNAIIEVNPFDVFRVEGDIDRLQGQRFSKDKIRQPEVSKGVRAVRLIDDQKVETDAQRLIQDARYSQQQALKDLHDIGDEPGFLIKREFTDAHGPEQQRRFQDGAGPASQRIISDADALVLPHHVRRASLHEPFTKARTAQQNALKEIHAIKDIIFSSSSQKRNRGLGPIDARTLSDASGPILFSTSSSQESPDDRKNISTEKLIERIKKARAEQQEALNQLSAMTDADGPIKGRKLSDLDLKIERANKSQLAALGYMKQVEDAVGSLIMKHRSETQPATDRKAFNDATGPVNQRNADDAMGEAISKAVDDASGPSNLRDTEDSSGPETPRHANDALGPLVSREEVDTAGPLLSRELIDAAGPRAPNNIDDAVGPTDRRLITDAKGPTLFHRIVEAVLPKKVASVPTPSTVDESPRQSSIAERIAKIKADQRDAIQQLDELAKDNDKPLI